MQASFLTLTIPDDKLTPSYSRKEARTNESHADICLRPIKRAS